MKAADTTAEVFVTAFEALPRSEREAVLKCLFADPSLKQDLLDVALWLQRRGERTVSYQKVRTTLRKAGRLARS